MSFTNLAQYRAFRGRSPGRTDGSKLADRAPTGWRARSAGSPSGSASPNWWRRDEIARTLGLEGKEGLIRGYGVRELASAVPTLSVDKSVGLASRIAGDALDLATLSSALHPDNPKRRNAAVATALVAGITLLDIAAYAGVKAAHRREPGSDRDYSDRSGLPRGAASLSRPRPQGLRDAAGLPGGGHGCGRASRRSVLARSRSDRGAALTLEQIIGAALTLLFLADIFLTVLYARAGTGLLAPLLEPRRCGLRSAPSPSFSASVAARSCRSPVR